MLANGWESDSILFMPSHYVFAVLPVALTYANSYAKASVKDNLCGYSLGATPVNGIPPPLAAAAAATVFGTGNGVPPTAGVVIINNNSVGGPAVDAASISPSTGKADYNYDGAKCLRDQLTNQTLIATTLSQSIAAVKRTANLRGKPAVIVQGRSDTLLPVNHASRPYYALNKSTEGNSRLAYYEVTNAQHFESFLAFPGYDTRLVPLHRYFIQAMDIVYANLRSGTAIPPSQVVRTTPRGGTPGAAARRARRRRSPRRTCRPSRPHRARPTRSRSVAERSPCRNETRAVKQKGRPRPPFFIAAFVRYCLAASCSAAIFFMVSLYSWMALLAACRCACCAALWSST
jgi:hydroxybutyrate-dimer hydrolase